MNAKDMALIREVKRRLSPDLQQHLKQLVVFGSRARSEATEDSDLDVIAIVDEKSVDIENRLEDVAYQVMWDNDFKPIISLKVVAESQFNSAIDKGFSFYRHIKREGVAV